MENHKAWHSQAQLILLLMFSWPRRPELIAFTGRYVQLTEKDRNASSSSLLVEMGQYVPVLELCSHAHSYTQRIVMEALNMVYSLEIVSSNCM